MLKEAIISEKGRRYAHHEIFQIDGRYHHHRLAEAVVGDGQRAFLGQFNRLQLRLAEWLELAGLAATGLRLGSFNRSVVLGWLHRQVRISVERRALRVARLAARGSPGSSVDHQPVADPAHGLQMHGIAGILLDLAAQTVDLHIDRALVRGIGGLQTRSDRTSRGEEGCGF